MFDSRRVEQLTVKACLTTLKHRSSFDYKILKTIYYWNRTFSISLRNDISEVPRLVVAGFGIAEHSGDERDR